MLQESSAQLPQRVGNAVAEILADALARLVCLGPPGLDDATGRLVIGRLQSTGMSGQPERGKVRIQLLREDKVEIGLDIGGPREAGVVAQKPQLRAIRDHAPQRSVFGIEVLLDHAVRRLPAAVLTETEVGLVKVEVVRHQQQGDGAAAGVVAQLELPVFKDDGTGRR